MQIKPACCLSDFAQSFFIELRFYNLSGGIFHERRSAIVALNGNERALRRADANRESSNAGIARGLRHFRRVATQLFAIRENDQRAISSRAFPKCVYREIDRFRDI